MPDLPRPPRWRRRLAATAAVVVGATGSAGCLPAPDAGTVTVLGIWTGAEQAEFRQVLAAFERETGIEVIYTGARDAGNVLESDVRNGEPPDLAILPNPYELNRYAGEHLVPLDRVLDLPAIEAEYDPQWREIMQDGTGTYFGVVVKATLKSLVWYQPDRLAGLGHAPPASWEELRTLGEELRAAGHQPWCLGLESSPSSGWPGTDAIEDILLHQSGPEAYQAWAAGELAWTSAEVSAAWQTWGELVASPGAVPGGPHAALVTHFSQAGRPLFGDPPGCYLHHAASFIRGTYDEYAAGAPVEFVSFPALAPAHANTHVVAADLLVMFRETPASRRLTGFLTTVTAQRIWPQAGTGAISVNAAVPPEVYQDPLARRTAAILTDPAARVYFDASDRMPASLREAFNQAVLRFLVAPAELETILVDLERVRRQAYA